MILVTGAAGKTGQAVIQALAQRGQRVRALIRRPEQAQLVEEKGAAEAIVGDMQEPAVWALAVRGIRAIYHICPNMNPFEVRMGHLAIDAAQSAGVDHFVYHSVLHPQTESMPHHWLKLHVEERLFESGLPFTILQPTAYMQNVLPYWEYIIKKQIYRVPYPVNTYLSLVDLEDVATVASIVLTEPGHIGATYELAGPEVLTPTEMARILSRHLKRFIRAETLPLETWKQQARVVGIDGYQLETLIKMFRYYGNFGFWGNSNVLRWLLRRPPTTFSEFVKRVVAHHGE